MTADDGTSGADRGVSARGANSMPNRQLAAAIAEAHGLQVGTIAPIVGGGTVNGVFVVRSSSTASVVRFPLDRTRQDLVEVEVWALGRAAAQGVPSPEVIASGRLYGTPYLVESFVAGARGTERRSMSLWHVLGEYAAMLGDVRLGPDAPDALFSRFGRDLPSAWAAHVQYNVEALTADDALLAFGVYPAARAAELRDRFQALAGARLTFGLNHGDLHLGNVVVPDHGRPVLLDWGAAAAGPTPFGDLLSLITLQDRRDDPSMPELRAFAEGCGISPAEMAGTVPDLYLLHSFDVVRWAIDRNPDRVPEAVDHARREFSRDTHVRRM